VPPNSKPPPPVPSEDRLSALLDAAVDAMVLIDPVGVVTRFNRAAEKVFGYSADEVVGRNVSMLMPAPYRDEHDGYLGRYLTTSKPHIIGIGREVSAQRKDGSTFPIDLAVGEFRGVGEHGFVGILRDISQRKRQEAELRERSEELRLIFENTPTAVTITGVDGSIINANRSCETLLGYAREELIGKRHTDLVAEEDRAALQAEFERIRHSGESSSREVRYHTCAGQLLYALAYFGFAHDLDGRPLLMIVEIVDRSALFAATREAEDLRARLAHVGRLGTLGEMVSGIAHEVNQPLTAIANYANAVRRLLLSGQAEPAEMAGILEKIGAQAERAGQVIRGLRSMTRKHEAARARLDCNALVTEVSRLVEFELRASGCKLQLDLAPGLPPVYGDGVQIQQVVLNLIRNGLEAMNEHASGDSVTVTSSAPAGAFVEISVADSGPGLAPDNEEHLFEPFYTTKAQGMGLGLSICKSIVAAHGGELRYRRHARGGAEFIMRLPTVTE
jgi:two-component system sensor kinase FixL